MNAFSIPLSELCTPYSISDALIPSRSELCGLGCAQTMEGFVPVLPKELRIDVILQNMILLSAVQFNSITRYCTNKRDS
jgi:hypothetical protein